VSTRKRSSGARREERATATWLALALWCAVAAAALPAPARAQDEVVVADQGDRSVAVFSILADANVAPIRRLTGALTQLSSPFGVAVDQGSDEIVVTDPGGGFFVRIYPRGQSGQVTRAARSPARTPG
jgi:hypothetical protein